MSRPGAAIDGVGAAATLDHVVAAACENLVSTVIADDHVGAVGDAVVIVEHFARVDLSFDQSHWYLPLSRVWVYAGPVGSWSLVLRLWFILPE